MELLELKDLTIHYFTDEGVVRAVNGLTLSVGAGETVGLVGETGAGKTTTALGIMNLVPDPPGRIVSGQILYNGEDLAKKSQIEMRDIRGRQISMIFQDPMTALNPVLTVGDQIAEVIRLHEEVSRADAYVKAAKMLEMVGIPSERLGEYPHQFSGGMKQRVVIAIALACNPRLLIADEPTTALDVTIQAQIIELLLELQQKENMALVLITHDLALVAEAAHKIIVMYAGQVVETGDAHAIFHAPRHPYTQALLRALPEFAQDKERLASLPGVVPGKYDRPNCCLLNPRCPYATDKCRAEEPALNMLADGRQSKCHYPLDDAGRPTL